MTGLVLERDVEEFVQAKIQDGAYRDLSEVVHVALRLLQERERRIQALRDEIDVGLAEARAGDVVPLDEGLIEKIKQRGRERRQQGEGRS